METTLSKFIPLTKIDVAQRLVYGIATAELPDAADEICDYDTTKPHYKEWSEKIAKASSGKSKGNLRAMHGNIAAGKLTQIAFNDAEKQIEICGKVVDDAEWAKVVEGVYTGFSQGGRYEKTWPDPDRPKLTRYTAIPVEVSLVDVPCLPNATFQVIKADGEVEMRKFNKIEDKAMTIKKEFEGVEVPEQVWLAKDGSTHATRLAAFKKNAECEATEIAAPANAALKKLEETLVEKEGGDKQVEKKAVESAVEVKKAEDAPKKESAETKKLAVNKGLGDVARAAYLIQELDWLQCAIAFEAEMEEDGSTAPGELKGIIEKLCSFLQSMCAEECNEIVEDDDTLAMAEKLPEDHATALKKFVKAGKITAALIKAGARHSKADAAHLSEMSDHLKKAAGMHDKLTKAFGEMGKCMKGLGMEGHGDDEDMGGKASLPEDLQKIADLEAQKEVLSKTVNEFAPKVAELTARLAKVESQPAAPKGNVFAVEKSHEVQNSGKAPVETRRTPRNVSPEEARREYYS